MTDSKQERCETCGGYGVIPFTGGYSSGSFEHGEFPCPDCDKPDDPASLRAQVATLQARVVELEREKEASAFSLSPEMVMARNDQLNARIEVLDGTWCAANQKEGRGPCGACTTCLRAENARLTQQLAACEYLA